MTVAFGTLGGEYRFAERLGLSGERGIGYFDRPSRSYGFGEGAVVWDADGFESPLGIGLHYYF